MSTKRAAMAAQIPRPVKRRLGRTEAPDVPVHIRAMDAPVEAADRDYLRRKLGMKLGKFARSIERISVRLRDVNGPRGGVDKACTIKVVLSGMPSIVAEDKHAAPRPAMDRAVQRMHVALRRTLERRKAKPKRNALRRRTAGRRRRP